jgi:hypothetical protein
MKRRMLRTRDTVAKIFYDAGNGFFMASLIEPVPMNVASLT